MYTSLLQDIFQKAWDCLQSVVIPAGFFGNDGDITLWRVAVAGTTIGLSTRFLMYCLGDDGLHEWQRD